MKVGIVGLGKLGLPMAAVYAEKGHVVVGLDTNVEYVQRLKCGICPIQETGLADLLSQQTIKFTTNYSDLLGVQIVFIIVPTPSDTNGLFTNRFIDEALKNLIRYKGPVVIVSTVMPGSCREFRSKYNLDIIYNPEFIALGSVVYNMLNPDSILIGEDIETRNADLLGEFHHTIHNAPLHRMNYENAELSKLALNCLLTTKITFANQIAQLCETLSGGNVDVVTSFLGSDSRIGSKYLVSGTGFGGPCFPRDNIAFVSQFGAFDLQKAVISYNNSIVDRLVNKIYTLVQDIVDPKIAILGTTYKTETTVTIESQALKIGEMISRRLDTKMYDPSTKTSLREAMTGVDLAVIATPWHEFNMLDLSPMRHKRVLDCWRILKNKRECEVYQAVGVQS